MSQPYIVQHTFVIVKTFTQILLGKKKKGFGVGKWNCFGGQIEPDETPEESAIRELKEECGLTCEDIYLTKCGTLEFSREEDPKISFVHVFKADTCEGEPIETEEMRPKWFYFHKVPYHQMWGSDKSWLPIAIENRVFRGHYLYDKENSIVKSNVEVLTD